MKKLIKKIKMWLTKVKLNNPTIGSLLHMVNHGNNEEKNRATEILEFWVDSKDPNTITQILLNFDPKGKLFNEARLQIDYMNGEDLYRMYDTIALSSKRGELKNILNDINSALLVHAPWILNRIAHNRSMHIYPP